MASIDFLEPPAFPSPRIDDFEQAFDDPWLDERNLGIDTRRRILTTVMSQVQFTCVCSENQRQNMLTFIRTTSKGGTLPFNWSDPRDGTLYEMKFATLPRFRKLAAYDAAGDRKEWSCSISLAQSD